MATDNRKIQLQTEVVDGSKDGFDSLKRNAAEAAKAVATSAEKAGKSLDSISNGGDSAARKIDANAKSIIGSIQRTTALMEAGEKGSAKYYEALAAQRGVPADALKPYLMQLEAVREKQRLAFESLKGGTSALENVGMSARATAAAMRGVPAQFTDIVTSLQGGQKPITVLLQQGGQLKDMFGGIGPAAKALGGYVVGMINPLTLAAAAIVGLGVALASVNSKDSDLAGLSVRLSATGRASLSATSDIKQVIDELGRLPGVSRSAAASIVDEFSRMQGVSAAIFKGLGASVADFAAATGTDLPTAAKKLAGAFADPVKGAKDLESALGTLTAEQLLTIEKMAALGDKAGAQAAQLDALQKATKGLANDAMTPLGRATDGLSHSWDGLMKSVGNSDALRAANVLLSKMVTGVAYLLDNAHKVPALTAGLPAGLAFGPLGAMGAMAAQGLGVSGFATPNTSGRMASGRLTVGPTPASELDGQVKDILAATEKYKSTGSEIAKVKAIADQAKEALAGLEKQNKGTSVEAQALRDRIGGLNEELTKLAKRGAAPAASTAGQSELASLRARGTELQRNIDALKSQGLEADKQTASEKLAAKYREELNGGLKGATRATKELQLAQAERNAVLEKEQALIEGLLKAQRDFEDSRTRETASRQNEILKINEKAQALEDEAAQYGKGQAAIQALSIARLEEKKAILTQFDGSAERIQQIDDEIAGVLRLGAASDVIAAKKMGTHTDQLLANAKEQASLYEDELRLTGLTALERAKIVAQRQVEIKYAKELEKLNQSNLSDADKDVQRQKIAQAQQIESSAAVSKVVRDDWAKTADQINQSLTDALMRGFESGKSIAMNLRDTVVNMFKTMVLRPRIEAGLNYASGALGLTGSANAATGGGGSGGGFMDALGMGGKLSSFNSGWFTNFGATLVGKGASLGADLFSKGYETIGSSLMDVSNNLTKYSDVISGAGDVLGYGSALYNLSQGKYGAAIGGAIGTYFGGPIGAAIGSALGGLLDGDGKPASKTTGDTTARYDAMGNRTGSASAFGLENAGVLQSSDALRKTYGDVARSLGIGTVATTFGTGGNSDGETTHFAIGSSAGGKGYQTADNAVYSDAAYQLEASRAVFSALQGSDLPKYLAGAFDDIVASSATQEQITASLNGAAALKQFHDQLQALPFDHLKDMSYGATQAMITTSGGLDQLKTNLGAAYNILYSDGERAQMAIDNLAQQFAALGKQVPANVAELHDMIAAQETTTEAGARTAAGLYALVPAFDSVTQASLAAAQKMQSALQNYGTPGELRDFKIAQIRKSLADGGLNLTADQIGNASRADARALYEQLVSQGNDRAAQAIFDQQQQFADITTTTVAQLIGNDSGGGGGGGGGASGNAALSAWESAMDTVKSTMQDLRTTLIDSGVDSFTKLQAQFAITAAQVDAGSLSALQYLPEVAKALVESGKTNSKSNVDQAVLTGRVIETLGRVTGASNVAGLDATYAPQVVVPRPYSPLANAGSAGSSSTSDSQAVGILQQILTRLDAFQSSTKSIATLLDQIGNGARKLLTKVVT